VNPAATPMVSMARSCGFAALFVVAALLGRLTILEGASLSLVWPAAGVAMVWFVAQRRAAWPAVDWVLLVLASMAVNVFTGSSLLLACAFLAANVVQIVVFLLVAGLLRPDWQQDTPVLTRLADLWRLVAAALLGTACGAAIGPAVAAWVTDGWSWLETFVWFTRNVTSVVLIGVLGLRLLGGHPDDDEDPWTWARTAESAAIIVCSVAAYLLCFLLAQGLPLAFPLLGATVWAGARWPTTWVAWHGLLAGAAAVLFTLHGDGPFAHIDSYEVRALVAEAFVGMIAVIGPVLALGRDERSALTRQLSGALAASSAQAGLLTTIVESISDGLVVVESDGRIVLRNPASINVLPGAQQIPGVYIGDNPHIQLADARGNAIPPEEMPHVRALAGENVPGRDMVVRHALTAEERILHVWATPLPIEVIGVQQAVVVYHDVTAERRDRDELTAFAGVVAHDLLNPLTTVDGWAETLAEMLKDLPQDPVVAAAEDSVVRIRRAAARMRHLINDLLVHATARDAALALSTVATRELVTEIAHARTDQATAAGKPMPRFTIGDLDDIEADPVLLRQLLDNLISNSIKYTAAGQEPHLIVETSRDQHTGFVRLTLTDNGIGIPPGQH
jgi:signal transduction histidine kinase